MEFLKLPSHLFPQMRVGEAIKSGVDRNLLFLVHGGIGDQICAEPTLRYALEHFKDVEISLAAITPELFSHLRFKDAFKIADGGIRFDRYLVLPTMPPTGSNNLLYELMTHFWANSVDFHSISALKGQIPVAAKRVQLKSTKPTDQTILEAGLHAPDSVMIHAGNNWQTRTYPTAFWDGVYDEVCAAGLRPVIIGKAMTGTPGGPAPSYVSMKCDARGLDLRDRCSLNDSIWLLQNATSVLCSDSGPLHMAVTGPANIAFLSTARHPDSVTHWREGGWGWRMKSFEKGGAWSANSMCPNIDRSIQGDLASPELVASWLPEPKEMVDWLVDQRNQ